MLFTSLLPSICEKIASRYQDRGRILEHLSELEECLRRYLLLPETIDRLDSVSPRSYLESLIDRCCAELKV